MSWNVKCPICGKSFSSSSTGSIYCEPICECPHKLWCDSVDDYVCGTQGRIRYSDNWHHTCEECDHDSYNCSNVDYCSQDIGEFCHNCNGDCDDADGCDSYFYFHPVWHKNIHCPDCGSWNVDTTTDIWNFKCNSCEKEFSLKKLNENKKKSDDFIVKKIDAEKEKIKLLEQYKSMLDNGVLTQEEFNAKKKEILSIDKD